MGSAERREREAGETRQKILDAARDLFVANGYEATSMRAIAKRIEYTPTAIYHHFESKEALLSELCTRDFRALASTFQKVGRVEDPVERIDRIGEAYVEFALEHPMHYQFMFMTVRPFTGDDHDVTKGDPTEDAYAFLRNAVDEAIRSGRFLSEYDDPDHVAQILWAALHGLISLRIAKAHDPWVDFTDVRRTATLARRTLFRGLLKG
jgi:AcrR family transcriptional regulator